MISLRLPGVAAAGTAALLLSSCSSAEPQAVGIDSLTVATLGVIEPSHQAFLDRLAELSEGTIRITVEESWTPTGGGDAETALAAAVASGEVDIAWVPVRSLSAVGVEGADVLETPLLIRTHDQQRQVATGVAGEIILGFLRQTEVEGLALLPGPQQFPVASGAPLLDVADWDGKTVGFSPETEDESVAARMITTLGATPTPAAANPVTDLVAGTLDGATAGIGDLVSGGATDAGPFLTANIPLWPKMSAIIMNRSVRDNLSTRQHGFVDAAVERARDLAMGDPDVATPVAEACAAGVRFGAVSNEQLAAFETAIKPVYEQLATNPAKSRLFTAIETAVKLEAARSGLSIAAACRWVPPAA